MIAKTERSNVTGRSSQRASVLKCGSPLPLWDGTPVCIHGHKLPCDRPAEKAPEDWRSPRRFARNHRPPEIGAPSTVKASLIPISNRAEAVRGAPSPCWT